MDYLDFEPGQRTIDVFRDDPGVLIGVIEWWWESATEAYYSIEAGMKPEPRRGFFTHTRHLVFWCDAELRTLDAAPLQEISDQISARLNRVVCPCGGVTTNGECNRCGSTAERHRGNWTEPSGMERTLTKAQAVKERILSLALATNQMKWKAHKAGYPNHDRDKFIYDCRWDSKTWKEIESLFNAHPEWEQITGSTIRKAADDYADRCDRQRVPRGKSGRPTARAAAK